MINVGDKYKVVIIDDECTAIGALRRELGAYREFKIKGAVNDGVEDKRMIMELRPDLLFLDVELLDVLGLNLSSEIRNGVLRDMRVVFYTSYDRCLFQALREPAFDLLLKPFETEGLKVVIERYRETVAPIPATPSSSFLSPASALMPQQGTFMISTVTGFKPSRLEEIGYLEYLEDERQW